MSAIAHVNNLMRSKQKIENQIHDAYVHHLSVTDLKKKRLKIEDEIYFLMSS